MDAKIKRESAYNFLNMHKNAALATVDAKGNPHVASVYTVVDPELNVYFTTRTKGRKYDNLIAHSRVAMTITDDEHITTIQLSGDAISLEGDETEDKILSTLWRYRISDPSWPVPPIKLFESEVGQELAIIKVIPFEMTYANFENTHPGRFVSYFEKII